MLKRVHHGHRTTSRWLAAGAVAFLALISPIAQAPATAAIEGGDTVYIGGKQGYGGTGVFPIWSETPADPSDPGEPEAWAYCVEHDVSARTGLVANVGDLESYLGSNYFTDPAIQGRVLWVLAHSYPALSLEDFGAASGAAGISRSDAIEATQYAIWRYTDLNFDAAWNWENADSEAAYWYLVNGANANPGLAPADFAVTAGITAPAGPHSSEALVGPFTVSTNQAVVTATVAPAGSLTDAAGTPIDPSDVHDGDELYLDLRSTTTSGTGTVTISAAGAGSTGKVISVPSPDGGVPTAGSHAQSIVLVAPSTATTTAAATVEWAGTERAAPSIGTSLVDSADQDRLLAWNGGTVIDTVAYQNLVPGAEYTVTGELMRKSDGSATGITGSVTFTPFEATGSVEVTFVVPEGYAGETLVAFEWLFEGADRTDAPVAVHTDIDDAAQTIVVEKKPTAGAETPVVVPPAGGTVVPPATGTVVPPATGVEAISAAGVEALPATGVEGLPALAAIAGLALIAGVFLTVIPSRKRA